MPLKTPICDFGQAAKSFELKSTINEIINLNDVRGENGTLIMFICNHCPYVIAVIKNIIEDYKNLKPIKAGESDLFKAMKQIAKTGNGPKNQIPSMGCGIKWLVN